MQLDIRCKKCNERLDHEVDLSNCLADIIVKVKPCDNLKCRDCSKCDDITKMVQLEQYSKAEVAKEAGPKIIVPTREEPSCADCQKIDCLRYGHKDNPICASFKE